MRKILEYFGAKLKVYNQEASGGGNVMCVCLYQKSVCKVYRTCSILFIYLSQYYKPNVHAKNITWRQNGGRLGDVTEAGRPVLRGLEVILQILRLGGHFCGDHGASAPPPSRHLLTKPFVCSYKIVITKCHFFVTTKLSL